MILLCGQQNLAQMKISQIIASSRGFKHPHDPLRFLFLAGAWEWVRVFMLWSEEESLSIWCFNQDIYLKWFAILQLNVIWTYAAGSLLTAFELFNLIWSILKRLCEGLQDGRLVGSVVSFWCWNVFENGTLLIVCAIYLILVVFRCLYWTVSRSWNALRRFNCANRLAN